MIGQSSAPAEGSSCNADLTCVLGDPNFSSASFLLASGDHSITGAVLQSPFGGGAGAFIVNVNAVPLPAAAAMLLSALAALGGLGLQSRRPTA